VTEVEKKIGPTKPSHDEVKSGPPLKISGYTLRVADYEVVDASYVVGTSLQITTDD
jgi:hypothetical protein